MPHRELVVDFTEVTAITIQCPTCESPVFFNAQNSERLDPIQCSACGSEHYVFREVISGFRALRRTIAQREGKVAFRIRE